MPVLLVLDLGAPWVLGLAKVVQIPAWSVCVSGCLQVEDPQWELSLRGLFAFASGSGIEFHYCVMELSLLHIPHPFLWLVWARTWDMCAGGQSSHQAGTVRCWRRPRLALPKTEAGSGSLRNPESVSVLFSQNEARKH